MDGAFPNPYQRRKRRIIVYILRISQAAPTLKTRPETFGTACEIRKWKRGAAGIIFLVCVETRGFCRLEYAL
jgi:hypothetical protein